MAGTYSAHMLSLPKIGPIQRRNFTVPSFKGCSQYSSTQRCSLKPKWVFQMTRQNHLCAMNMTAGHSDDHNQGKISLDQIINTATKYWDKCPEPVKIFPWNKAFENFIQLILDLILAVGKYLCVPLLAVTSLSEMSYCAHERKLFFTPIPLLMGAVVASILGETFLEVSPILKEKKTETPWHLVTIAIFFTLLKLPGPYYPYWGRIFIPHFANGGLWRTLWDAYFWYRGAKTAPSTTSQESSSNNS